LPRVRAIILLVLLLVALSSNFSGIKAGEDVKIKEVKVHAPPEVLDNEEVEVIVCVVLESNAPKEVAIRILLYDEDFWRDDIVDDTEIWVRLEAGEKRVCHAFMVVPSEIDYGEPPDLYAIVRVYELDTKGQKVSYPVLYGEVKTKPKKIRIKKGIPVYLVGYVECDGKPLKKRPVVIESIEREGNQFLTEWVWNEIGKSGRGRIRLLTNEHGVFATLIHIPIEEAPDALSIWGEVVCSPSWDPIPNRKYYTIKFDFGADLHFNPMKWLDVFRKIFRGKSPFKPDAKSLISLVRKLLSNEGVNVEELPAYISLSWLGYFGAVHIDCCWEEWDLPEGWEIVEPHKRVEAVPDSNSTAVYCNKIDYELCWEKIEATASKLGVSVERVVNASMFRNYARILILGGHKAYLDDKMKVNLAELLLPESVKEQLESTPGAGTALLITKIFEFAPKPAVVVAGNTRRETHALLEVDIDGDGLNNLEEGLIGTNPLLKDTDSDGIPDPEEKELGTNPLSQDTDGDGISDGAEMAAGTNPLSWTGSKESNLSWALVGWARSDSELGVVNITILNLGPFKLYGFELRAEDQSPQTLMYDVVLLPVNWSAEVTDQKLLLLGGSSPLSPYEYIQISPSAEVVPESITLRVLGEEGYLGFLEIPVEVAG